MNSLTESFNPENGYDAPAACLRVNSIVHLLELDRAVPCRSGTVSVSRNAAVRHLATISYPKLIFHNSSCSGAEGVGKQAMCC
jgi:hypothetical protein